jgi:hypothetical protein
MRRRAGAQLITQALIFPLPHNRGLPLWHYRLSGWLQLVTFDGGRTPPCAHAAGVLLLAMLLCR